MTHHTNKAGQPVNQQMLAALKLITNDFACAIENCGRDPSADKLIIKSRSAIAAAEAAQPVGEQPRCACGDSFTIDAVCANCLAAKNPASAQPVAVPEGWREAVTELLTHIEDVTPDEAWERIDHSKWNRVSSMLSAAQKGGAA